MTNVEFGIMGTTLFEYLTWALPSGGLGAAIAWFANKKQRRAQTAKEVHDIYKQMYADLGVELINERNEHAKLYSELSERIDALKQEGDRTRRALNRLTRAIEAIQTCPHRATCPVSDQLSLDGEECGGGEPAERASGVARQPVRGKRGVAVKRKDGQRAAPDTDG